MGDPTNIKAGLSYGSRSCTRMGLAQDTSDTETAPAALKEDSTQLQSTPVALADSRDGYAGVAAQIVLAYAPVETAEFGDVRGAVMTLETLYRHGGESRMQALHDQLASSEGTATDEYDAE